MPLGLISRKFIYWQIVLDETYFKNTVQLSIHFICWNNFESYSRFFFLLENLWLFPFLRMQYYIIQSFWWKPWAVISLIIYYFSTIKMGLKERIHCRKNFQKVSLNVNHIVYYTLKCQLNCFFWPSMKYFRARSF